MHFKKEDFLMFSSSYSLILTGEIPVETQRQLFDDKLTTGPTELLSGSFGR